MSARWKTILGVVGMALGTFAVIAALIGAMWWGDELAQRERDARRAAQQDAYTRANEMCDGKPIAIIPHDGLTWWLEVKCADGTVRAVPTREATTPQEGNA